VPNTMSWNLRTNASNSWGAFTLGRNPGGDGKFQPAQ
jgi:hypothetical protein